MNLPAVPPTLVLKTLAFITDNAENGRHDFFHAGNSGGEFMCIPIDLHQPSTLYIRIYSITTPHSRSLQYKNMYTVILLNFP